MRALVLSGMLCCAAGAALAGPVETACLRSDRSAATRAVCNCIGRVADQMLNGADQRRGATFFRDPERAQKARLNDSSSMDAFWERWTTFGAAAEASCVSG
jgi:hypothetical protein